jgi:cation transport ATPase
VGAIPPDLQTVLNRPASERLREHKYRFAQCIVFGIPVLALQFLGPRLGGGDSGRWTGLLQSLLGGWIVYIGAVPLIAEGFLLIAQRQFKIEMLVALGALVLYIIGLVGWIMTLRGRAAPFPIAFSCSVVILVCWSGVQWLGLRKVL